MANPEHVKLVKQGADAIEKWRKQHPTERLDLIKAGLWGTNLRGADLKGANINSADLWGVKLIEADLSSADLNGANLIGANLGGAHLPWAELFQADLSTANLSMANLVGTDLTEANLSRANLKGTNLAGAICHFTMFGGCNLHQARGLQTIKHEGPSSIGVDTLIQSFRGSGNKLTPELETFFRSAGVPKELLDALPGIIAEVKYYSCFISYGEQDYAFADKMCSDLKAKGVSCWLYSKDATPGKRTQSEIVEMRRGAEKMVTFCSAESLTQAGVLKEIEEQIDEDPDKMVPISLDNIWKKDNFLVMRANRNLKPFLLDRNYADFSSAIPYDKALEKLLKGLERKQVKRKKQMKQS